MKFLIYISYSYAIPIGEPLEVEIKKRGYFVRWFSDTDQGLNAIKHKPNFIRSVPELILYEPHIILSISDYVPDFINSLKVQIFHGFLSKKRPSKSGFSHFRIRGLFDLYCTQGPSSTIEFKRLEKKYKHFKVVETGWSKVDDLFLEKKQNLKNDKPKIFIASTFTRKLSLAYNDEVFSEIQKLSISGKYYFNMVLHPKLPAEIKEKWKSLNSNYFKYHETTNLNNLFKISDLMFSDTTSAIQEFLLMEKPVIAFNHTFDFDYLINISEVSEIYNSIKIALNPPDDLIINIKEFNKLLHPYYDGKSSARVIDASLNCLYDKSKICPKPFNFVRKLKLRNKLNYYKIKSFNEKYSLSSFKSQNKISVLIITYNEIDKINDLIENVSFADEIIVLDSFSDDGTAELLKSNPDIIFYQRKFTNFSDQRNYAINLSKNDWVLFLDADERLSNSLVEEINSVNLKNRNIVAYKIFRKFLFKNTPINFSGYQNDSVIRLFNKNYVSYRKDKLVHETLVINGKVHKLRNKILHLSYSDFKSFKNKMLFYAKIKGKELFQNNKKIIFVHFIFKPLMRFFYHFIIRLGFLDGKKGLIIAYLNSLYVYKRYEEYRKLF